MVLSILLSLEPVTLEEKEGERKHAERTSGHGDGVRAESSVSWAIAQIRPEQRGPGRKRDVLTKSKKNMLQEACQCDPRGFKWKLQREKGKSPRKSVKPGKMQRSTGTSARAPDSKRRGSC